MNLEYRQRISWIGLGFALALCMGILLATAGWFWWHNRPQAHATSTASPSRSPLSASEATVPKEPVTTPINLSPQRLQSIGVQFGVAKMKPLSDELRVPGNVMVDERRVATVQTRFPGWVRDVYVNAAYQYIRKGQPLFTLYSPDLVATEQEYLLARKNASLLRNSTISGVATGADSLLAAARDRLAQWDIAPQDIRKIEETGRAITNIPRISPVSGYVTERDVLPNMYVQPGTRLYTVADLSTVWVDAQVFQADLGKVRLGAPATVTVDSYPGQTFRGHIDFIYPQVDESTRTARVRLVFANSGLKLKPGMYVNAVLRMQLGKQLVVPASAVFHSGTRQLVFVNGGGGQLTPREVETGLTVGSETVVTKGLKSGESIVISSAFLIDSESQLQAAVNSFAPITNSESPEAVIPKSQTAKVTLNTEPSPPHKGSNLFRVKVTDQQGHPIEGAQVTVTFYMPAMPAMGMAAMRTLIPCAGKRNGLYEGTGTLESGGSWQVNITVQKNGNAIASQTFTMAAEGGM